MRPSGSCMHLGCPRLVWLLGLMFLTGLGACGPASTDKPPRLEPGASLGGTSQTPSVSQHAPAPRTDPVIPGASPAPLASSLSPYEHVQAHPTETLVGPDWMSAALASPDVRVRLWALDHWEQHAPTGSMIDPLIEALDDEDEAVQEKASAIIERYWAVEQERD